MDINTEIMYPGFTKHWMEIGKHKLCLHHFTAPDTGPPHNHPLGFTSTILRGGYIEEIWSRTEGHVDTVRREAGAVVHVEAKLIHKIIHIIDGECITSVQWHDWEPRREWYFWYMHKGVMISSKSPHATFQD